MKKVFKNLFALAFCSSLALGFAACSDEDTDPTSPKPGLPDPDVTTDMIVEGYYKGDIYETNTGNLWINFLSKDLVWDADEEDYTGNGELVCIDLNTVIAENPDYAELAPGTYTGADDHAEFTMNIDYGDSFVVFYSGTTVTEQQVVGGTVNVSKSGANTVIDAALELENGETYDFEYTGPITLYNRSGEGKMSNLTADINVTDLTQGLVMYGGAAFTETSDYYMVVLSGADFDLETNYGNAPSLNFGLNVAPGSNSGIPTGTYSLINAMEAEDYDVNTALSGVYEPDYGGFFGTWYYAVGDALEAAMQTGTVKVVNNGNNNYEFTFDLKDGYGHSVKGSYSGNVLFADAS